MDQFSHWERRSSMWRDEPDYIKSIVIRYATQAGRIRHKKSISHQVMLNYYSWHKCWQNQHTNVTIYYYSRTGIKGEGGGVGGGGGGETNGNVFLYGCKIQSGYSTAFALRQYFKFYFMCEQVLFVRFTIIPPRLTDQCNFITVL